MHWVNNLPGTLQQVSDACQCLRLWWNLVITDVSNSFLISSWELFQPLIS